MSFTHSRQNEVHKGPANHPCDNAGETFPGSLLQPIFDLQSGEIYAHQVSWTGRRATAPHSDPVGPRLGAADFQHHLQPVLDLALKSGARLGKLFLEPFGPFAVGEGGVGSAEETCERLEHLRDALVFAVSERSIVQAPEGIRRTLQRFKEFGFQVAVADLGSGHVSLKTLLQLKPDFVKAGRQLVRNIHQSAWKQILLSSVIGFCRRIGVRTIADRVECREELTTLWDLRVDLVQGPYLAGFSARVLAECPEALAKIQRLRPTPNALPSGSQHLLESLLTYVRPVQADEKVLDVASRMDREEGLICCPVVRGNKPVGLVQKNRLFYKLGRRYGCALYERKAIAEVMDPPLIFEADTPIETASRLVTARDEESIYDAVVVTKNGAYMGLVKVHHLLERITEQKLQMAVQANPLTGLPGNNLIRQEISERLHQGALFAVGYVDVDHFKPFNDRFGFDQGDAVIRLLGKLLKDTVTRWDPQGFVGHIGGDDFVFVVKENAVEELCRTLLERFQAETSGLYEPRVLENGFYEAHDRTGTLRRYPLLSLSIAVITNRERRFTSCAHVASVASEVKTAVKKMPGSAFLVDRRTDYIVEEQLIGPHEPRKAQPYSGVL